jgi:hypothetical protein
MHKKKSNLSSEDKYIELIQYLVDALGALDDFSNRPNPADLNGEDAVIGKMVRALYFAKTKGFKPTKS